MRYFALFILILLPFFLPEVALAEYALEVPIGEINEVANLTEYLQGIYVFLVGAVGIVSTTMIMWGGMKWVLAAGSADKIGDAKKTIIEAIVGLVLVLASYSILTVLNAQLVTLAIPEVAEIVIEDPELPTLNACNSAEITCTTDEECMAKCGNSGQVFSCLPYPGTGNKCINTSPNNPSGSLCAGDENCLPGLKCVKSDPDAGWGACSDGSETALCNSDDDCESPMTCELLVDGGWFGDDYYTCAEASGSRGYDSVCTSSADCDQSKGDMECRDFGGTGTRCTFSYPADCRTNLGQGTEESNSCVSHADCRTGVGGDCVADQFCCSNAEDGFGGCNDSGLGSCVIKGGPGSACDSVGGIGGGYVCLSDDCLANDTCL